MTQQSGDPPAARQAPHGLGTLEAQLMGVLWETSEQLSVQGVVDGLGPGHNYKTAMTVLNRLVEKGLLRRELDGRAYRYRPAQTREQFLRAVADELVREYVEAYGASSGPHLTHAIDSAIPRPETPAAAAGAAPQPYANDEPEPRSSMWRIIGIAAALQIVTLLLRRRR